MPAPPASGNNTPAASIPPNAHNPTNFNTPTTTRRPRGATGSASSSRVSNGVPVDPVIATSPPFGVPRYLPWW
ncbi:hypothetical protein GCM10010452_69040 [Crossiella cryophila]